jgi:hypothetical protein
MSFVLSAALELTVERASGLPTSNVYPRYFATCELNDKLTSLFACVDIGMHVRIGLVVRSHFV